MKSIETAVKSIRSEIARAIVGQDSIVDLLLVDIFAGGHAILEGVPGLAKTMLINSLAMTLGLSFNRVQFTPDLIPSDITGTEIMDLAGNGEKSFRFVKGPVFTNILLADEINRTPPKTQSALLQAMQEKKVTVLGSTHVLPDPFYVFATQNPIEYEGTYPLPEAELDRFLLQIDIGYPNEKEEWLIVDLPPEAVDSLSTVMDSREILSHLQNARKIPVSDKVKKYAVSLTRGSRPEMAKDGLVKKYVRWGAGPRASQMLVRASRAHAYIHGKKMVEKEDVDALLVPSLKHRLVMNYQTVTDGVDAETVLLELKKNIEVRL